MQSKPLVGCSGYYYSYWKARFYPEALAAKDWLSYYGAIFDTVELNGTFYKTPRVATLKKYADQTPEHFRFSVKMSKNITHNSRLKDTKTAAADFQDLVKTGLKNKLLHFLFQLPPSFRYSDENLDRVSDNLPHGDENVIEFRHASWWNETVRERLSAMNISFCNVDYPSLEVPFMHTSKAFYLRLHGNPLLFKSSYDVPFLENITQKIPAGMKRDTIYFNNTYYEGAYLNAAQLKEILVRKTDNKFKHT